MDVQAVHRLGELRIPVGHAGATGRWRGHGDRGTVGDVGVGSLDAVVPLHRALGVEALSLLVLLLLALTAAMTAGSSLLLVVGAGLGGLVRGCGGVARVLAVAVGGGVVTVGAVVMRVDHLDI